MVAGPRCGHLRRGDREGITAARIGIVVGEVVDHLFHAYCISGRTLTLGEEAAHVGIRRGVDVDGEGRERAGGGTLEAVVPEVVIVLGVERLLPVEVPGARHVHRGARLRSADASRHLPCSLVAGRDVLLLLIEAPGHQANVDGRGLAGAHDHVRDHRGLPAGLGGANGDGTDGNTGEGIVAKGIAGGGQAGAVDGNGDACDQGTIDVANGALDAAGGDGSVGQGNGGDKGAGERQRSRFAQQALEKGERHCMGSVVMDRWGCREPGLVHTTVVSRQSAVISKSTAVSVY